MAIPDGISLRYAQNVPALGQSRNVERLFAEACGTRLVLLHDDDVLLPGAITALDAAWTSAPDVVLAYGMQEIIVDSGESSKVQTKAINLNYKRGPEYAGVQQASLVPALWRQIPNDGYLVDSKLAQAVGYHPFDDIGSACDVDFAIRLSLQARGRYFALVKGMTSQYRLSTVSVSRSGNTCWKLFDYVKRLDGLTPDEATARDLFLEQIAPQAVLENALHGRRRVALRILRSRYYRGQGLFKTVYHLGVIVEPRLVALRNTLEHALRITAD